MRLIFLILLLSPLSGYSRNKFRAHGENLQRGGWEIGVGGYLWNSSARFDEDGNEIKKVSGEKYQRLENNLFGTYSVTKNLEVRGDLGYRINSSVENDGVENQSLTTAGLHHVGMNFNLMFRPTDNLVTSLEGEYRKRMFTNPTYTGDKSEFIILGNERAYVHAGPSFSYVWNENVVFGGKALFRNVAANVSNDILFDLMLALERETFTFYTGVKKSVSLKSEKYETTSEKPSLGNGATNLYNGLNQEFGSLYLGVEVYLKNKYTLGVGLESVIQAKSYDTGNKLFGEFKYTFGEKTVNHREHTFKTYSIEGYVIEVASDNSAVMVNAGLAKGVKEGMRFDFFHGGGLRGEQRLIATGYVTKVYTDQAVVTIKKYFKKEKLGTATFARADH